MKDTRQRASTVAVIGSAGVPAAYGGFETLVENLLGDDDARFAVYCSGPGSERRLSDYKGAKLHYIPLPANGAYSIPYDLASIIHAIFFGYRQILLLGVSAAIFLPLVKLLGPRVRVVTNIDGLEWKRQKWGPTARFFLNISEKLAVKWSDIVIADNQAIADHVREAYGRPSELIAYGGDHAFMPVSSALGRGPEFALSVCRIEPENNVHVILKAFACSGESLKIIGNWDNSEYGRNLRSEFGDEQCIDLIDPVYDTSVLARYRADCEFYVHGHSAGGTNPSLVEIMHFGKPVVAFDCVYNRATLEGAGRYFRDESELLAIIKARDFLDDGEKMLEIAQRRYTWRVVRAQYISLLNQSG